MVHTHLLSRYFHFSLAFFTRDLLYMEKRVEKREQSWDVLFYCRDGSAQK